jgi:hypothetical protein
LTATTTCKAGKGTIILSTTRIGATTKGSPVTVAPATVTVSATCGRSPTLTVAADAVSASVGPATVSTSACELTLTGSAPTTSGTTICSLQSLICQLNELLVSTNPTPADVLALLNQILPKLSDSLTL